MEMSDIRQSQTTCKFIRQLAGRELGLKYRSQTQTGHAGGATSLVKRDT